MQANNISRKELAKHLGTSPAYITKILRGDINFTVDSMVRLAKAAGGTVQIHIGQEEIRIKSQKHREPFHTDRNPSAGYRKSKFPNFSSTLKKGPK
jgi:plasmid maintenance system antidote protein VapI